MDNNSIDNELSKMLENNHQRKRMEQIELAKHSSIGEEKRVLDKREVKTTGISTALCISLILGGLAFGTAATLEIQDLYHGSKMEYKHQLRDVNNQEIERIKSLLEANGLNVGVNEDYSALRGLISDGDIYGFYQLFKTMGYRIGINETNKIIGILAQYYPDKNGSYWNNFCENVVVAGETGFYAYYYLSDGTLDRRVPSRDAWERKAGSAVKAKYDVEMVLDNQGYVANIEDLDINKGGR